LYATQLYPANVNTSITCGQNATGLNAGQGYNTWNVYANDSAGNEVSDEVTFL